MDKKYIELLQHMLGADSRYKKKEWGFRNHFCASEGHSDLEDLKDMERFGLVESGSVFRSFNFYATRAGAVAIGFQPYQLKKVFNR